MPRPRQTIPTKNEVRKSVGKGQFTLQQFADARGLRYHTARKVLGSLVEFGDVESTGTRKHGPADAPTRGRPVTLYRVTAGPAAARTVAAPAESSDTALASQDEEE